MNLVAVFPQAITQHINVMKGETLISHIHMIITGDDYERYDNLIESLECENLSQRRIKICENFIRKMYED